MLQVSCFRQPLRRVENLSATDRCAPKPYIIRVFQFREVGAEPVLVQVVDLFLTAQCHVAGQGNDFYPRGKYQERHIETNLIVTGSRRAVCDSVRTDLVCITGDCQCLEDTFGTDGDRISAITENIAEYHIFQALFVILLRDVERYVFDGTQFISIFFVLFQLFRTETTGIGTSGIHFIPFFLSQIHHSKRGVETSTECYYYFLLLLHSVYLYLNIISFLFFFHILGVFRIVKHCGADAELAVL